MKNNAQLVNNELIPIYETVFENELYLEKISNELNNAVNAKEIHWIEISIIHADKIRSNFFKYKNSKYKKELEELLNSFNIYYKEASYLAKYLIEDAEEYTKIHEKTTSIIIKHNNLIKLFQNFRKELKVELKENVDDSHLASSTILLNSSFAFILWIILSIFGIIYIYRDLKSRINQIVTQSENIAQGKANFHKRLTSKSNDELGLVVNSINSFINKLEVNHKELEDVKNDIKRFIEDTAHQIRTPLSSILINSEMIKEQHKDDSSQSLFDSIDASINMLSNSYEDLLYISSYDSIEYLPSYISLSELVTKRIEFFETICRANSKTIQSNISKEIYIYMNQIECERIIDNNISNAVKYSSIDTPITIELYELKESKQVILEFKSYSSEIKNKEKIFEKNFREDSSNRGLGLGLNMVKNICNKISIDYKVSYLEGQNIFTYTFKIKNSND
jgi:signal transduction histidine kinase